MFSILYIFNLFITLLFVGTFKRKYIRCILTFSALLFGIIGLVMIPRNGTYIDTVRFFEELNGIRDQSNISLSSGWNYLMGSLGYDSVPVAGVLLWLVSLQSENGLLTFIVATLDILAGYYLVARSLRNESSKLIFCLCVAFFLFMFNFNASVSGVRNVLACSLAMCITYKISVEKKIRITYLFLYLLFILIHPFAIIVPLLYFFSRILCKNHILYYIFCVVLILQHYLQQFIFKLIATWSDIPFFSSVLFKSTQYFGQDAYIEESTSFSRFRTILIAIFLMFIIANYLLRKKTIFCETYFAYILSFAFFTIGAFSDEILFSRCVSVLLFAILPLIPNIIRDVSDEIKLRIVKPKSVIIFLVPIICLFDNLRSGLRFQVIVFTWFSIFSILVIFLIMFLCLKIVDKDG